MVKRLSTLLFGLCLAASCTGWSAPVDLSAPGNELGSADPKGYLQIWREVDGVGLQLGKGSYLPLRYRFSTESDREGLLGAGFSLPMFEARNVLLREDTMRAYLPCGKGLYLWRTANDPNKFQTPDKVWTGYATADDFTVSRDDGWKVIYRNGRLVSITSDDNHKFAWSYDGVGGGNVAEDGKIILTMEPGSGGQIADFVFGGKSYKVEYGKRPIFVVVGGQTTLKALAPALVKLELPDGRAQTFEFGLTDERMPKLASMDADGPSAEYTWDGASRHLVTEKNPAAEWRYKIGDTKEAFGMPTISRTSGDGKNESTSVNVKEGVYTLQNADGSTVVTRVFKTPGPLYDKVQKVESVEKGVTSTIYRAAFDDAGRIIRETNAQGRVTAFAYDEHGKLKGKSYSVTKDPEILARLHRQEQDLTKQIADAGDPESKQEAIRDLAEFYLRVMRDKEKAAPFVSQIDHDHMYMLRVQGIDAEELLTPLQKAEQFRQLLTDYPNQKSTLNALIAAREREGGLPDAFKQNP